MFYFLDILGTFIFAITGGLKAVRYNLDFLGVVVLSVIVGVGGGIVRDLIIGYNPPTVFRDELYLIVSILAGILVFFVANLIEKKIRFIIILDAIGLGVFSVIGASKALEHQMGPLGVVMMAILTSTGGGVIRDIFVREIPAIIRRDFYATASLLGGITYLISFNLGLNFVLRSLLVILVTTGLRLLAVYFKIELPRVKNKK